MVACVGMTAEDYKYIDIDGISIAYTDRGSGQPVLFIHGFASFSFAWMKMIGYLPSKFRFITIDLKGHGYSEKICDDRLAPFDQAMIVAEFIKRLELDNLVLAGHSMGGAISLIALFSEDVIEKVSKLILLDSSGFLQDLPKFIDDLSATSPGNPLVKFANEDVIASAILKQEFFNKEKISDGIIKEHGDVLRQKNAKECLIAAAQQMAIPNIASFHEKVRNITLETLIVWGENDAIVNLDDAFKFQKDLHNAEVKVISNCGHSPQEEAPLETARLIADFLGVPLRPEPALLKPEEKKDAAKGAPAKDGKLSTSVDQLIQVSGDYIQKLRMRKLVDRWSFGTLVLMAFIKILQLLKKAGFTAKVNGWRKVAGIFLRKEHSKFVLATFRLNYLGEQAKPESKELATILLIERLANYLRRVPACHWRLEWGFFMANRKKVFFTDIVEAEFGKDGILLKLNPHFDKTRPTFTLLNEQIIQDALAQMISSFNEFRNKDDRKRTWIVYKKLLRWVRKRKGLSLGGRHELRHLIERILNASFIQFDALPEESEQLTASRLATPNMKNRKHPGFGLLNIVCRMTFDFSEADLWFQHHHVPVDGMPMQETLEQLKAEWGEVGPVKYPALLSKGANAEIFYFGNKIFRARIYVNFDRFLKLRKHLNNKHYAEMGGPATVAGLVIWGLAAHKYFRDRKFLFPVDSGLEVDYPQERNISLVFIRPREFFNEADPLKGFLNFQREFNRRLFATQAGKSESYEVLELYAMIHPVFYYIAHRLMPKALGEVVGSAGVTILKSAEMFVSPLTDLQINGFVAFGNLKMPTEDGGSSGAVSICGSREQVRKYIEAISDLTENYSDHLGIEL